MNPEEVGMVMVGVTVTETVATGANYTKSIIGSESMVWIENILWR